MRKLKDFEIGFWNSSTSISLIADCEFAVICEDGKITQIGYASERSDYEGRKS